MIDITTTGATKTLSVAGARVNMTAGGTRLRAIVRRHFDQGAAGHSKLVPEHLSKSGQSSTHEATRANATLHSLNVQFLDHDNAVVLDKSRRLNVKKMLTLPSYFLMQAHHASLRFGSSSGSLLASIQDTLCVSETFLSDISMFWVFDELAVRASNRIRDPAVDGYDGTNARFRIWGTDLANDRREPLIPVFAQGTGFGFPDQRTMNDRSKLTKLRKVQLRTTEAPFLGMWLGEPHEIFVLRLPPRFIEYPSKIALPCPIKLHQDLGRNIARDCCEPRQIRSQVSEIIDLIKRCRVAFAGARQAHQSLLVSDIPKETKSGLPLAHHGFLPSCRVHAVTKSLTQKHCSEV